MMLLKLLGHHSSDSIEATVFSLRENGPVGEKIREIGIPVRVMDFNPCAPNPIKILTLTGWLRQGRFDIVQTWMYHADLIGGVAAKLAGNLPVVWGIHHTDLKPASTKRSTLLVAKTCALISRMLPDAIVSVSQKGIESHIGIGYCKAKMQRIPNGFDLEVFKPDSVARAYMRKEFGLGEEDQVVGIVGRFHPIKDFATFVKAAGIVSSYVASVRFVLCGEGLQWENDELASWIRAAGITDKCYLLGKRDKVHQIMSALDIFVSSSRSESFPLAVGEAMACGVPCVVTDVGDSELIIGNTGLAVQAQDPGLLAEAIIAILSRSREERQRLGAAARKRIRDNFSLPVIARQYEELYRSLLDKKQKKLESMRGGS